MYFEYSYPRTLYNTLTVYSISYYIVFTYRQTILMNNNNMTRLFNPNYSDLINEGREANYV